MGYNITTDMKVAPFGFFKLVNVCILLTVSAIKFRKLIVSNGQDSDRPAAKMESSGGTFGSVDRFREGNHCLHQVMKFTLHARVQRAKVRGISLWTSKKGAPGGQTSGWNKETWLLFEKTLFTERLPS